MPAGTNPNSGQVVESEEAPALVTEAAPAHPEQQLALAAGQGDGKVEGPALRYERGEGKAEVIKGKEQRRERRADRIERQAQEAAAGILPEKKSVENPKKNGDRSQIEKKGSQVGKPERRPKKDAPKDPPQGG